MTAARQPGAHVLYQLKDGEPIPTNVKTGIADSNFTEILQGNLREGNKLIIREIADKEKSGSKLRFRMF